MQVILIFVYGATESGTIQISEEALLLIEQSIGLLTSLLVVPIAIKKVYDYQTYLRENYSTLDHKDLKWLRQALYIKYGLTLLWLISFSLGWAGYSTNILYEIITLSLAIVLFGMTYFLLLNYHLFQIVPVQVTEDSQETIEKKLSPKTDAYYEKLMGLMQDDFLYKDSSLTLSMLAERLQISSGYLSQIINEKDQKNFFEFINRYRVEAVKKKLLDKEFEQFSIMGIASDCGFSSKSAFNSVFKQFTGLTPTAFRKQHL